MLSRGIVATQQQRRESAFCIGYDASGEEVWGAVPLAAPERAAGWRPFPASAQVTAFRQKPKNGSRRFRRFPESSTRQIHSR